MRSKLHIYNHIQDTDMHIRSTNVGQL